jgi:hypothetical protein
MQVLVLRSVPCVDKGAIVNLHGLCHAPQLLGVLVTSSLLQRPDSRAAAGHLFVTQLVIVQCCSSLIRLACAERCRSNRRSNQVHSALALNVQ